MHLKKIFFLMLAYFLCFSSLTAAFPPGQKTLTVGVFNGYGASIGCVIDTIEAIKIDPRFHPVQVSANDILNDGLDKIDVLVFAGGSGSRQTGNLGHLAAEKVRQFVRSKGKGIVGICAGAYLLSDTPDYACLNLCPIEAIDRDHDARGNGIISFTINQKGLDIFPELKKSKTHFVHYYEGPLSVPAKDNPQPFTELAHIVSDVHLKEGAPSGMTPGKPLFLHSKAGKGKIFLSVGHPETTPGMRWMIPRMVGWVVGLKPIQYPDIVVRPHIYSKEILFDKDLRKVESDLFQLLLYGDPDTKIASMQKLVDIHSWSARMWIPGLLRDKHPQVRTAAAKALADIEYTAVIPELKTIAKLEKDPKYKKELAKALELLEKMIH
jgi:HEAT repeats/Biotin-protein ligase, N terminal